MNQPSDIREGEPLRFSLASVRPIPRGLLDHARRTFAEVCSRVREAEPMVPELDTLSLLGVARRTRPATVLEELHGSVIAAGADCALTRGEMAERGPDLIVSDVDSTLIDGEVIEMLAEAAGSMRLVADVTARAMAGELDFAESLALRVATLRGLPSSILGEIANSVVPVPGAQALVSAAHAHGAKIALVSGGFHEVVDVLAARLGIEDVLANRLDVADGRLTGRTHGAVVTRESKADALKKWAARDGIALERVVAMGDGANDLAMMEIAGLSVAMRAKPLVLDAADAAITVARLDILAALLGWDCPTPQ